MDETSIKKFYDGADIFITGGSGFVGRVLIEKLLRSCEGISRIFLLMRGKKGIEAGKRIEKLTDCMLFEKLRSTNPSALNKLEVIEGDMMQLRLGISSQNFQKIKNCSQIFHCAASVRFDDPLKDAILMNTRGTREVCLLAMEMPNLKSLVHVSTTFIQPKTYFADEVFYPADFEWQTFIKMAENFDHDMMNCLEKKLTKHAPNTYTFTKHLAEQVCNDFKSLPIVIVRPSIICSSEFEPFMGWSDNLNGPAGAMIAAGFGVNHVGLMSGDIIYDYIPVDICAKGMIVAGWKKYFEKTEELQIYNASTIKTSSMRSLAEIGISKENPPLQAVMYCSLTFTKCSFVFWVIKILEGLIPAVILDQAAKVVGEKPRALKVQRIIFNSERSLSHFTGGQFKFMNRKFIELDNSILKAEKEEFSVHEKFHAQNSKIFTATYHIFMDVLFNQKPKDAERAKNRYKYVIAISRTYQVIAYAIFLWICQKIVFYFMNKII